HGLCLSTNTFTYLHHVGAQTFAVPVYLGGHLLLRRKDRLELAEVDQDVPRILALLDDAGDDVVLAPREFAQGQFVLGVTKALQDDLLGGGGGDASETGAGARVLAGDLSVLVRP